MINYKKLLKLSRLIMQWTFLFWITETIVFLFMYGLHTEATEPIEILFDIISLIFFSVGLMLLYIAYTAKLTIDKTIDVFVESKYLENGGEWLIFPIEHLPNKHEKITIKLPGSEERKILIISDKSFHYIDSNKLKKGKVIIYLKCLV